MYDNGERIMRYVYRIEDSKTGFVFNDDKEGFFSAADALREMRAYRKYYKTGKNACVCRYVFHSERLLHYQEIKTIDGVSGFIDPNKREQMPDTIYKINIPDSLDPNQKYDKVFFNNIIDAREKRNHVNWEQGNNVAYIVQTEILDINPDEYDSRYEFIVRDHNDIYLIAPNWWATI